MRVLLNGLPALGAKTGVGQYTLALIRGLKKLGSEVVAFPTTPRLPRKVQALWARVRGTSLPPADLAESEPSSEVEPPAIDMGPRFSARWFSRHLVRFGSKSMRDYRWNANFSSTRFDVYHEPNFIPRSSRLPTVATIHDLSCLLHPEWHPPARLTWYEQNFRDGLERTDHFVTVSDFCRQEVIRTLNIAPERVTRTYNGVSPELRPLPEAEVRAALPRVGLPPSYLLHVGTLEPRKNLLLLMKAYCDLPLDLRLRFPLLLVGGWGWKFGEINSFFRATARYKGVVHVGYVPDEDLPIIYNGARALVFPTFYEGFGLPSLEMMACGGAVLASTAGAVAETTGGKAHLIDPHDLGGWRDAMQRVLTDDDWWLSLRHGTVEAARPFTWQRCVEETLAVYRQTLAGSSRRRAA